jgi:hypothetical protein
VEQTLARSPNEVGLSHTRWRLKDIGQAISWLKEYSIPGIYLVFKHLGFSLKQSIGHIHSPDPEYATKWEMIQRALQAASEHPGEVIVVYLDELTYYRRPSKAPAYCAMGHSQPRAVEIPSYNTQTRIAAVLNAMTGQVTFIQRSKVGVNALNALYAMLHKAYPQAKTIYVIQDNWPVHKLSEVSQCMSDNQLTPLFLPTYASWLNPIEKLWKWLKQDVVHLHPLADDLDGLRLKVSDFLSQFDSGSRPLLRYVGLLFD